MGIEPFQEALAAGAQVVLGGRAYDPACFAALPIMQGFDEGLALHCGKILECAAIAATPGSGSDCAMGILDESGFTLKAFNKSVSLLRRLRQRIRSMRNLTLISCRGLVGY